MEHGYRVSVNGKEPRFTNPMAVYVIELTIPAYILVVETLDIICMKPKFFSTAEQAKGKHSIPAGAETYFGKIDSWEEFVSEKIDFDKRIACE